MPNAPVNNTQNRIANQQLVDNLLVGMAGQSHVVPQGPTIPTVAQQNPAIIQPIPTVNLPPPNRHSERISARRNSVVIPSAAPVPPRQRAQRNNPLNSARCGSNVQ